jgi:hypothetical protein
MMSGNRLPSGYRAQKSETFPSHMMQGRAARRTSAKLPELVAAGGFGGMRTAIRGTRPVGLALMATDNTSPSLSLRPREAAKALSISPRLLWQLTKDGHVPCVRVGAGKRKTVLYPVDALQRWLREQAAKGGEQ